jgi:hypothetical protein
MNLNPFASRHPSTKERVSPAVAKQIGNTLFVDWRKISPKALAYGMNIELEHESTLKSLGVKDQDMLKAVARIALDHFAEDKLYYEKLKKVEGK